jgi:hypothetical protein
MDGTFDDARRRKGDELLCKVGLTLKDAQQFEFELRILVTLLGLLDPGFPAIINFDMESGRLSHKTAGTLIRRLGELQELPDHAQRDLQQGLEARNYVVHGFFARHLKDLHLHDKWDDAIEDLGQNALRIKQATVVIVPGIVWLSARVGVDVAEISEQVRKQVTDRYAP